MPLGSEGRYGGDGRRSVSSMPVNFPVEPPLIAPRLWLKPFFLLLCPWACHLRPVAGSNGFLAYFQRPSRPFRLQACGVIGEPCAPNPRIEDEGAHHPFRRRCMKADLRAALPDVKSSHCVEALARGLGWSTNPAMRSALSSSGPVVAGADEAAFLEYLRKHAFDAPRGCSAPALESPIIQRVR